MWVCPTRHTGSREYGEPPIEAHPRRAAPRSAGWTLRARTAAPAARAAPPGRRSGRPRGRGLRRGRRRRRPAGGADLAADPPAKRRVALLSDADRAVTASSTLWVTTTLLACSPSPAPKPATRTATTSAVRSTWMRANPTSAAATSTSTGEDPSPRESLGQPARPQAGQQLSDGRRHQQQADRGGVGPEAIAGGARPGIGQVGDEEVGAEERPAEPDGALVSSTARSENSRTSIGWLAAAQLASVPTALRPPRRRRTRRRSRATPIPLDAQRQGQQQRHGRGPEQQGARHVEGAVRRRRAAGTSRHAAPSDTAMTAPPAAKTHRQPTSWASRPPRANPAAVRSPKAAVSFPMAPSTRDAGSSARAREKVRGKTTPPPP